MFGSVSSWREEETRPDVAAGCGKGEIPHASGKCCFGCCFCLQPCAELAADLSVPAVITSTATGTTARLVSKYRPPATIIAAVSRPEAVGQLTLSWGVFPVPAPEIRSTDEQIAVAVEAAVKTGLVKSGDTVVVTAGVPVGVPGNTSLIRVIQVD